MTIMYNLFKIIFKKKRIEKKTYGKTNNKKMSSNKHNEIEVERDI